MKYLLGLTSETSIEISPEPNQLMGYALLINQQTTADGYNFENKKAHYNTMSKLQYTIIGNDVGSSTINYFPISFFSGQYLPATYNRDWVVTSDVYSVMIVDDECPMQDADLPYDNRYSGTLKLEGY
jgi:hypothetical protein